MESGYKTHFATETVTIGEGDESTFFVTSQLMETGDILVSLDLKNTAGGIPKISCTHCCEKGENDSVAIASAVGYPSIEEKIIGDQRTLHVEVTPLLRISDDKMTVEITLFPPVSGVPALNAEALRQLLKKHNIVFGIDELALAQCEKMLSGPPFSPATITIAHGIYPVHGSDSFLRFEMETGPIPGTLLKNGTIDYRERKVFVGVEKDQVIATKVRETTGTAGYDVYRNQLPAAPGRDLPIKLNGDVLFDEQSRQITATQAGVLSIVNDCEIKVSAKQTIDGDVDFSVGNLQSNDSVEIRGSVLPSFSVRAKGDLLIHGNVQAAKISSHGNVVIRGGVLESKAKVYAQGDIDVNFIERSELQAGGTITLRKSGYYCQLISDKDIICNPECRLMGAVVQCAGSFTGTNVGSPQSEATQIMAGVNRRRYERYMSLKLKLKLMNDQLSRLETLRGSHVTEDERYLQLRDNYQSSHQKMRGCNLSSTGPEKCADPLEMYDANTRINILGTIYYGTILRIGNYTFTLKRDYTRTFFQVDPMLKTILAKEIH